MSKFQRASAVLASAVFAVAALVGCAGQTTRDVAVENLRAVYEDSRVSIEAAVESMPEVGLRTFTMENGALGDASSMIAATEDELRQMAYEFQGPTSLVLDATDTDHGGEALLYVSSYFETGGGGSYNKEIAWACVLVSVDRRATTTVTDSTAPCPDHVLRLVSGDGEVPFESLSP